MNDQHPDVVLAIQHREERKRQEEAREREPEVDLHTIVAELAALVSTVVSEVNRLRERVSDLEGRLS